MILQERLVQTDNTTREITAGTFSNIVYETSATPSAAGDTMMLKVDGADWTPESITHVKYGGNINISGSNAAVTKVLGLVIPENVTPGTYNFEFFGDYM